MKKTLFVGMVFVLIIFAGYSCKSNRVDGEIKEFQYYEYMVPENTGDGWDTASLQDVGMAVAPFVNFMEILLNRENHEIHSVLVIKDGLLVFEEYFSGHDFDGSGAGYHGRILDFDRGTPHNLHSATKSITSTLLGIAIDRGLIADVNERVYDFFPQYDSLRTPVKNRILLRHLLNMRAGWSWNEWNEPITSMESNYMQMLYSEDPLGFVLARPMEAEPGTLFDYSGGVTNVLGQVIEASVGTSFEEFADTVLFNPLGISNRRWPYFPSGMILVSGDLHIRPRDMAKIGFLFINDGKWKDRQVVSVSWIEEVIRQRVDLPDLGWADGYGYQWWFQTFAVNGEEISTFRADGWGGQMIVQVPQMDMVVVFTGANYSTSPDPSPQELLEQYIFPSAL